MIDFSRDHLGVVTAIKSAVNNHDRRKHSMRDDWQKHKRDMELVVRNRATEFLRGVNYEDAASLLGISKYTLRDWNRMCCNDCMPDYLGRPVECASLERIKELSDALEEYGLSAGVQRFKSLFPDIARSEIAYLLNRRRSECSKQEIKVRVTLWKEPGMVWAMDFTKPPLPIDGIYKQLLVVRDLSSGNVLIALPVENATEQVVHDALLFLFEIYGVPLCIKSDNGSQFKSELVTGLFTKKGIAQLLTPVRTPEYNGAIEAGMGALKIYIHHESARNGRPGQWTCDDVEAARLKLNATSRPRGINGPCPDEILATRKKIPENIREKFLGLVEKYCTRDIKRRKIAGYRKNTAASMRLGIRMALEKLDVLEIVRSRITQVINPKKTTDIR